MGYSNFILGGGGTTTSGQYCQGSLYCAASVQDSDCCTTKTTDTKDGLTSKENC